MRRGTLAALVLSLLGLGVLAFLVSQRVERVSETVVVPPAAAARANPFLACARFLDAMGVPTRSRALGEGAPPEVDLLLVLTPARQPRQRRARALLEWTRAGGHLVLTSEHAGEADPLLEELGIERFDLPPPPTQAVEREFELAWTSDVGLYSERYAEQVDGWFLDRSGEFALTLSFPLGRGRVTALSSSAWLTNEQIGAAQHAHLLWDLVSKRGAPRRALVIHEDGFPSLASLLVRHAWTILLPLLLCLALGIHAASRRFGPLTRPPSLARRSLLEHVGASGEFSWRHAQGAALLEAARAEVLEQLQRRRPNLTYLSEDEQHAALAAETSLSRAQIARALRGGAPAGEGAFVACVASLQTLWSTL